VANHTFHEGEQLKYYKMQVPIDSSKLTVVSALFWKFLERGGVQGVQFIVQILLARLLLPQDYGLIAILFIFITIAQVVVQGGLETSLIQKKEIDEVDYSSIFFLSLAIAGLLYGILFISAPFIANFYQQVQLTKALKVMALSLFLGGFNSVQNAIISRTMQFKKLFFSSIGAVIISGVVGISLAYAGYGLWALVFQQLTNQVCTVLILWFIVPWRPHLEFSFSKISVLLSFSWKLLVSAIIGTIYNNIWSFFVGKVYSPTMLGYYSRGQQFPQSIVYNINGSIQSVLLPALSSQQDYSVRVKAMVRRSIVTSSYIIFPMMMGLAVIAKPLVLLLLTEKWLPSVPFLQMFCASFALWPIHTANLQAINAIGRTDIFLKLEIIKKIIGICILIVCLPFGVYVLTVGQILVSLVSSIVNAQPNKKLLDYGYLEQIKDILPSLLLSLLMGSVTYSLLFFNLPPLFTMILQVLIGISLYLLLSVFLKLESYVYLKDTLLSLGKRKIKTLS
jgi:O-antigen/teichoic acid export membrane protein